VTSTAVRTYDIADVHAIKQRILGGTSVEGRQDIVTSSIG